MNAAISCIEDTIRLLLDEAKQASTPSPNQTGSVEGFEAGRSEALKEVLHTWSNQLQTFGLEHQLNGTWEELSSFLSREGF